MRAAAISDRFSRALIEQTSEMVNVLAPNGTILYVSPSYRNVLGYDPETLLGKNSFDLVHGDDRAHVAASFDEVVGAHGARGSTGEYRVRHADGSWRTLISVGTNLIDDPTVGGILVNARDVTGQNEAVRLLAERQLQIDAQLAELELLYQTTPVGLALLDCDLRFVRVNDQIAEWNGLGPERHIGRRFAELFPDHAAVVEPVLLQVIETATPVIGREIRASAPANRTLERDWLVHFRRLDDARGHPIGVHAVVQDITERKLALRVLERSQQELATMVRERTLELEHANAALRAEIAERERAEDSLRRSESRYRYMVENISDVIFTVDREGRLTYISPTVERLTGHTPDELLGRPCFDFIEPEDQDAVRRSFRRTLGGISEPMEYRIRGRQGQVRWVRSHGAALLESGRAIGLQGVLSDITQRRSEESEAHRRQVELAHTQRLTTAGEMTAEIAHQINQPLAAISNFANGLAAQLRQRSGDHQRMEDVARRISAEALRAGEIIRQLRNFLRKGEGLVRLCDLNDLVVNVYRLIEEDFRREGIDVRLHLADDLPAMELNVVLIEQVVLNLLRNALEAMAAAGPGAHRLDVTTHTDPGAIGLAVRDTGVGLPDGAEPRVFEAFFTTKPEGLGLGLSVSRSIIEASDGRLWVERNEGGGATAGFTLPRRASLA